MLKKVQVLHSDGEFIVEYPVITRTFNTLTKDSEYFDSAWECAIEDGLVSEEEKSSYKFIFVE